jgi:hypothetical protein
MTPLAADQIGVWRRPGALLAFWAWRWFAAWLLATPIIDAIAGSGLGQHPRGDALLFEPGGVYLFETVRLALNALLTAASTSAVLLMLSAFAGLLPLAGLIVALAHDGRLRFAAWGSKVLEHFPAFVVLTAATWLMQAAVLGFSVLVFAGVRAALAERFDERLADLSALAAGGAVLLGVFATNLVFDLAKAAVVRHSVRASKALVLGFRTARSWPRRTVVAWLWPALLSLLCVIVAAIAVDRLAVDRGGPGRVTSAWVVHQLTAFALVVLRATWLASALRLVDSWKPPASAHPLKQASIALSSAEQASVVNPGY